MNYQTKSPPAGTGTPSANSGNDQQAIDKFFSGWAPYVQLPANHHVRGDVKLFLAAETPEQRRAALEKANLQFRLQRAQTEAGILRPDQANGFTEVLALSRQKLAEAIRQGNTQDPLGLLQKAFAFGRFPPVPNQQAATLFLLEFWALHVGGASLKYCTYAKGLPFSAGGKTHEELARVFVASGYGSGNPLGGGQIARRAALDFEYDVTCTVFRGGVRPEEVKAGILRWIRTTGGDDQKVNLKLVPAAG